MQQKKGRVFFFSQIFFFAPFIDLLRDFKHSLIFLAVFTMEIDTDAVVTEKMVTLVTKDSKKVTIPYNVICNGAGTERGAFSKTIETFVGGMDVEDDDSDSGSSNNFETVEIPLPSVTYAVLAKVCACQFPLCW